MHTAGCLGCATDIAYKDNHLSILRQTHPQAWKSIMNHGMADELRKLKKFKGNGRLNLADASDFDTKSLLDVRPCAFDDLGERMISDDQTTAEYDPEEI